MTGLPVYTASEMGRLQINPGSSTPGFLDTDLRCPAWWVTDLSGLYVPGDLKGEDIDVPFAGGDIATPWLPAATTVPLELHVVGEVDRAGTPASNPLAGLEANLADLAANVHGPRDGTTATRAATLTTPGGNTLDAQVRCTLTILRQKYADAWCVLSVKIMGGEFA